MNNSIEVKQPEFTGIRAMLWPIHNYELKKFIPIALIMFCIIFNYTLLRDVKEVFVVQNIGTHVIPYLKGIAVTISAVIFVIIYAKLSNIFSQEKLFYVIMAPFLLYFALFGFVLYPSLHLLHPSAEVIQGYHAAYPALFGVIDMYAYWVLTSYYVMAELWGNAMITLIFWQFANAVVRYSESKRFYGLFAVVGNAALIFSGQFVSFCSVGIKEYYKEGTDTWLISVYLLMFSVVAVGVITIALYRWLYATVLTDKRFFDVVEAGNKPLKKKNKPSLVESVKIISRSPELLLIFILIMAYGVTINLIEVQWLNQLKLFFKGDSPGQSAFMGQVSLSTGIFAILFGLFVGSNILRTFSWLVAAIITPAAFLIGGALFFIFICSDSLVAPVVAHFNATPVAFAAYLGAGIVILSKSVKYTLFDPTKEMAYIPLDEELKSKGKAAVEVIGGRFGKGAGGYIQMGLLSFMVTQNVVVIAPYAFGIFTVICLLWLLSVTKLSPKVAAAILRRAADKGE